MALTAQTIVATSAAPATNAGVAPGIPIPDNCWQIMLRNTGGVVVLYGQAAVGTPLVAGTNALTLPINEGVVLPIGTVTTRGSLDPATVGATGLVYGAAAAAVVEITYICKRGEL